MLDKIKNIKQIENMNILIDQYQGFLIDLWGVVHDGVHAYPGVVECLNTMIDLGKKIIFLSNAPRPGEVMMKKLVEFGIRLSAGMMLTSGDAVRHQLSYFEDPSFKKIGKRCFHLGAERNHDILSGLSVDITENLNEADFILLTLYRDEDENLHEFDDLFKKALANKLPMLCANPDKLILFGAKPRYCAGFFAQHYQEMGGDVYYYGKPDGRVYDMCFKRFEAWGVQNKKQLLMIGDTLETDILGANQAGIDSALVLTGNTWITLSADNTVSPAEKLKQTLNEPNLAPTWIVEQLSYSS